MNEILPLCVVCHKEYPDFFEYRFYTNQRSFFWESDPQKLGQLSGLLEQYWGSPDIITQFVDEETQTENLNLISDDEIDQILEMPLEQFSSVYSPEKPQTKLEIPFQIHSCDFNNQTADVSYLHSVTQTTVPIQMLKQLNVVSYAQFLLQQYSNKKEKESSS